MASWSNIQSDQAFGPQFGEKFDFTLEFEHTVLSILPATLFLAGVPIFFLLYQRSPSIVLSGQLLWFKLASTAVTVGLEAAILGLWNNAGPRASPSAIAASTVLLISALCLAPTIYWEHKRTLRSTSFVAIWLLISALCDIIKSRSYFLRPGLNNIAVLTILASTLKLFTLGLDEISKSSLIADPETRQDAGPEATSGFLSRTLFVWINRLFLFGFKNILRLDSLDGLGPAFRSQYLSDHLNIFWNANDGYVSGSLEVACLRANMMPWLSAIFPRLCLGIFIVSQPLLLKSVVTYIESGKYSVAAQDGLIIAAVFVYGGLALSKVTYEHICYRIATQVRGMLVAQTSSKSLRLKYADAQRNSEITLMNVDMKIIAIAIPRLHHIWIVILQTAVNVYVLSQTVQQSTILLLGPFLISIVGSYFIGKELPSVQKQWTAAISRRVEKTTKMLRQIKAVKMTGLEDVMTEYVQGLRESEVEHSKKTRLWILRNYVIGTFCDCITSPVVLAGGIFWTGLGGADFTPANVFTTLASVSLIGSTLKYLPDDYGFIQNARGALQRFEQFLALEERKDPRQTDLVAFSEEVARSRTEKVAVDEKSTSVLSPEIERSASRVIEFYEADVAVEGSDEVVLAKVNIVIERRELVMVIGPTGGGKSTLLRGILGEIELLSGHLYVEAGLIAYCDQTAWIWNGTIQVNIIGNSPVDMGWYDAVLEACLLKQDLRRLPLGDQTNVGTNGGNLSGGQKQRVALARALFTRSPFLVLDDILSTLDRRTAAEVFSRLFGPNGLLTKSMTTVIMATHSIQFLSAADRIIIVGEHGDITTRTDVTDFVLTEDVQAFCNEITEPDEGEEDEESDGDIFEFRAPQPAVMDNDIVRQKGDFTIYSFYARTFQAFEGICWFLFMVLTAAGEVFSDGYVRIWMELDPQNRLWYIGYVLIGSSAAAFMMLNLRILFFRLLPHSSLHIHRMLLDVLMRAKLSFLTGTDHGSLINRISQDLTLVSRQLPEGGMRVMYYFCRTLLRIGMIIAVTGYTAIILPVITTVIYLVQLFYLRTSRQLRYLELETGAPLCTQFTETAVGLYHIRAFGWQHHCQGVSLQLLDNSQKPFYYMYAAERWLGLVMDSITLLMALTIIIIALCVEEIVSASGVALSMLSLITLSYESMQFVRQWMLVETSIGALARTRDFIQNTPIEEDPDEITRTARSWPEKGAIVMQNVVAKYSSDEDAPAVLDNISLDIAATSKVGIVGRTGSGKSSIVMTLLGFLDYTGTITIDGVDIARISRKKLRAMLTVISQDDLEFDGTVRYNLCPNPNDEHAKMPFNEEALIVLLDRLQLLSLLDEKDPLGTQMSTLGLSHGQKQLMSIARSCIRNYTFNTRIIIMDEATSNLDKENENLVLQVFRELFFDCTVLTVAHRTETLKETDMTIKIVDGRIDSIRYPKQENEATTSSAGGPPTPTAQPVIDPTEDFLSRPVPQLPTSPRPVSHHFISRPTSQHSYPRPTSEHPYPRPTSEHPHPRPTSEHPHPRPTSQHSYPRPTSEHPYPRPTSQHSYPRPTSEHPYPRPTSEHPYPRPTSEHPYPRPTSQHPIPSPTTPRGYGAPRPAQAPTRPASLPNNSVVEALLRRAREYKDPGERYNEEHGIGVAGRLASRARGQVDRLREKARIQAEEEENAKAKRDAKIAQKREIDEARRKRKADKAARKAKGRARWGKSDPVTEGAGEGRAPAELVEMDEKVVEEKIQEKESREVEENVQEGDQEEFDEKGKGKIE